MSPRPTGGEGTLPSNPAQQQQGVPPPHDFKNLSRSPVVLARFLANRLNQLLRTHTLTRAHTEKHWETTPECVRPEPESPEQEPVLNFGNCVCWKKKKKNSIWFRRDTTNTHSHTNTWREREKTDTHTYSRESERHYQMNWFLRIFL